MQKPPKTRNTLRQTSASPLQDTPYIRNPVAPPAPAGLLQQAPARDTAPQPPAMAGNFPQNEMAGNFPQAPAPGPQAGPGMGRFAQVPPGGVAPPPGMQRALERLKNLSPDQARELGRRAAMSRKRNLEAAKPVSTGYGDLGATQSVRPTFATPAATTAPTTPTGYYGGGLLQRAQQLNSVAPKTPDELMREQWRRRTMGR